jgi:hypothetical protein
MNLHRFPAKKTCFCRFKNIEYNIYYKRGKTGIQALERNAPTKPMIPGHPEKIEFEHTRRGTLSLIPSFDVATGKITQ